MKRGLEILALAMMAADMSDARFLLAVQTVALTTKGRTPYYLEHMKASATSRQQSASGQYIKTEKIF